MDSEYTLTVTALGTGEVRLSAVLVEAESRHGAMVRGMNPARARQFAIELLQKAEEASALARANGYRA